MFEFFDSKFLKARRSLKPSGNVQNDVPQAGGNWSARTMLVRFLTRITFISIATLFGAMFPFFGDILELGGALIVFPLDFGLVHHMYLKVRYLSVRLSLGFSFVFSAPLPAWGNLFSASGIFCSGRYQQGCTGISDQWKVSVSLSLFLKSEKIPALLYVGKGHVYRPFPDFWPEGLASGTDLQSQKGLYSGLSPIPETPTKSPPLPHFMFQPTKFQIINKILVWRLSHNMVF